MSGIETVGIVLGAIPIILRSLESYADLQATIFRFSGSYQINARGTKARIQEYGPVALLLDTSLPEAIRVMRKVEEHVFHAEDKDVVAFMKSYTSSFNMIGVAGAIIAQVAITAMSLTGLEDSHWTAEAFFVASLVTGSLSVYFSCAVSPALNGLHSAEDIKNFLAKPVPAKYASEMAQLLSRADQLSPLPAKQREDLEAIVTKVRWKVPSMNSAIMLVMPMTLLNIALSSFLIGLGIYLGKLYTANLIPTYRKGSLGILIFFILTCVFGIGSFFFAQSAKQIEDTPIDHYHRILHRAHSQEAEGATEPEDTAHPPTALGNPRRRVRFIPRSRNEDLESGLPVENGGPSNVPQSHENVTRGEAFELQEVASHPLVRGMQSSADSSDEVEAPERPVSASEDVTSNSHEEEHGGGGSAEAMEVSRQQVFQAALEDLIRVQTLSLQASQRLLEAFREGATGSAT